jgi:hypothetical protein
MANTKGLDKVEQIYRDTLKNKDNTVEKEKLKISWGGEFEFDAVVREKGEIVEIHCLSTANCYTASDRIGNSKLFKVFHDAQMMLLTDCKKNILAFVDDRLYKKILQEQQNGRFYPSSQISVKFWDLRTLGIEKGLEVRNYIEEILKNSADENGDEGTE